MQEPLKLDNSVIQFLRTNMNSNTLHNKLHSSNGIGQLKYILLSTSKFSPVKKEERNIE